MSTKPVVKRHRHRIAQPHLAAAIALSGMLHQEVTAKAGLPRTTLSQVLRGHRRPTVALQNRLALALNRPVEELFPPEAEACLPEPPVSSTAPDQGQIAAM